MEYLPVKGVKGVKPYICFIPCLRPRIFGFSERVNPSFCSRAANLAALKK